MYTQAPTRKAKHQPVPIVFVLRNDPEPSSVFVAGECICKACASPDLNYIPYLEDAKCAACHQWQNEALLPS